jgi:hypothetical protein
MDPWRKWAPLVGALVGLVFFAQRAALLWKARKRKQILARRPKPADPTGDRKS